MRFSQLPKALLRRWYLTLVGLLCVAGACVATLYTVPPTYQAQASVLLLPPQTSLRDGANPFLYLGGLSQPAEVLAKYLASSSPKETFADKYPTASYDVSLDVTTTNGPILAIVVDDRSSDGAQAGLTAVLASIPEGLAALEQSASVPDGSSIGTMVLARDKESTPVTKSTLRAVGAVGVAGAVLVVLGVGLADTVIVRLKTKRRRGSNAPHPASPQGQDHQAMRPSEQSVVSLGTGRRAPRLRPTGSDPLGRSELPPTIGQRRRQNPENRD